MGTSYIYLRYFVYYINMHDVSTHISSSIKLPLSIPNTEYTIPVSCPGMEVIDSGTSVDHQVAPVRGFALNSLIPYPLVPNYSHPLPIPRGKDRRDRV